MGASKSYRNLSKAIRGIDNTSARRTDKYEADAGRLEHLDNVLIVEGILSGRQPNGSPYTKVSDLVRAATENGIVINGSERNIDDLQSKRWVKTLHEVGAREMARKRHPSYGKQPVNA